MGSPLCTRVMKGEVLTWVLRREPGVCTRHVYVCAHVRCRQLITLEDRGVGSCQHSLERESYALEPCGVLAGGSRKVSRRGTWVSFLFFSAPSIPPFFMPPFSPCPRTNKVGTAGAKAHIYLLLLGMPRL